MNYCVIGLAFGDEGKGTTVDFLTRRIKSKLTVRFSGGPQASHHVMLPDGRWHGFAQWGAGTFAGARTYLSEFMMIEPYAMWNEADRLKSKCGIENPWTLLTVDPDCLVITPWHWKMNRLRERNRGSFKHGSCGMGIGETRSDDLRFNDSLRARDLKSFSGLWNKLDVIRTRKVAEAQNEFGDEAAAYLAADEVYQIYEAHRKVERHMIIERQSPLDEQNVIFEGSQGILIDETLGTAPYNTWSDVTPTNALKLSSQSLHVVGVVSKIWSRHGAGPFPTEASCVRLSVNHNRFNEWQGGVRYGWFDHDLFQSVLRSVRVDSLAVTKLDIATGPALDVDELGRPVLIKSYGPTHSEKTWVTR